MLTLVCRCTTCSEWEENRLFQVSSVRRHDANIHPFHEMLYQQEVGLLVQNLSGPPSQDLAKRPRIASTHPRLFIKKMSNRVIT